MRARITERFITLCLVLVTAAAVWSVFGDDLQQLIAGLPARSGK